MRLTLSLILALVLSSSLYAQNYIGHGYSIYGELKYGPDFTHFDYVNPAAEDGVAGYGWLALTRALDRVLLWGHYVVPNWYSNSFRVLNWDQFGKPATSAPYTGDYFVLPLTWWYDNAKAERLMQDD